MNRDLLALLALLAFALLAALLYRSMLSDPDPVPVAAATPAPRATPIAAARATPRPRPVATPRPVQPEPEPVEEEPEEEVAQQATLHGAVVLENGGAPGACDVFVTVGGRRTQHRTAPDGTFKITTAAGPTSVYGGRRSGSLHTRSPPVQLDTSEGGEWEVTLVVEDRDTGGLGIGAKAHPTGLRITRIFPGGPAEELGLVRGDVIIEVEGEPTAGWSTTRLSKNMTGPVGTTQYFRVKHVDGSEENYEFERRVVERAKNDPRRKRLERELKTQGEP